MPSGTSQDRLNGPWARGVAALVLVAVVATLVYLHRYELLREGVDTAGLPPEVQACVDERLEDIDDQIARGRITKEMAGPIREGIVNFCQQTVGEGG